MRANSVFEDLHSIQWLAEDPPTARTTETAQEDPEEPALADPASSGANINPVGQIAGLQP